MLHYRLGPQVHVLQGRNYPSGIGGSQVRLVLLPSKKQRRKTRVRQGNSPQYMESFLLSRVNPEDVNAMGVRVRVYMWGGRMRRERLLGEARVSFDQINLQLETTLWLTLQPPPTSPVSPSALIIHPPPHWRPPVELCSVCQRRFVTYSIACSIIQSKLTLLRRRRRASCIVVRILFSELSARPERVLTDSSTISCSLSLSSFSTPTILTK